MIKKHGSIKGSQTWPGWARRSFVYVILTRTSVGLWVRKRLRTPVPTHLCSKDPYQIWGSRKCRARRLCADTDMGTSNSTGSRQSAWLPEAPGPAFNSQANGTSAGLGVSAMGSKAWGYGFSIRSPPNVGILEMWGPGVDLRNVIWGLRIPTDRHKV